MAVDRVREIRGMALPLRGEDIEQPIRGERGRLLHDIDGSGIERAEDELTRFARHAYDDDRNRFSGHLLANEPHTVQVRHDEVARDHIGLELDDAFKSLTAVARGTNDFEKGTARQQLRDDLPDVGRIVDDENAQHAGIRRQFAAHLLT